MNLANVSVTIGLVTLAFVTMPYGLLILAGMAWIWRKG